jgi:hypothetical protein
VRMRRVDGLTMRPRTASRVAEVRCHPKTSRRRHARALPHYAAVDAKVIRREIGQLFAGEVSPSVAW